MRLVKTKRKFGCEINITALIDIVFLLIIFSMVVSQFTKLQAEQLALPSAHTGRPPQPTPGGRVVVNVLPTGRIVVGGHEYSGTSLEAFLAGEVGRRGAQDVSVVIRSDENTPWEHVSRIMQACAAKGIARVKVAALLPGESSSP